MDPVFGIEYRDRKSDRRFGITPSLIARYTTGTALGLKLRTKFGTNDWLVLAVALTNGSNTTEQFHFYDEIDSNAGKTGSGRLAIRCCRSRSRSARRAAPARRIARPTPQHWMWFYGFDLMGHWGPVELKGQWMTGHADGEAAQGVYGLDLHQGALPRAGRDADVVVRRPRPRRVPRRLRLAGRPARLPDQVWRATVGLRWVLTPRAVLKAEYLHERRVRRHPADRRRRLHDQPGDGLLTRRPCMDQNRKTPARRRTEGSAMRER